jgi:hypothetical protein
MKCRYITRLLEDKGGGGLNESDRMEVEKHTLNCSSCLRAYRAAQISKILLRAHTLQPAEPPPFFKTRVMSAFQKQLRASALPFSIKRLWKASVSLVISIAVLVLVLLSVNFFGSAPQPQPASNGEYQTPGDYPIESVLYEGNIYAPQEMSYGQVVQILFSTEEANGNQ